MIFYFKLIKFALLNLKVKLSNETQSRETGVTSSSPGTLGKGQGNCKSNIKKPIFNTSIYLHKNFNSAIKVYIL